MQNWKLKLRSCYSKLLPYFPSVHKVLDIWNQNSIISAPGIDGVLVGALFILSNAT